MTPSSALPSPAHAPEIKAVLFDYGMVLSAPPDPANWARLCEISGIEGGPLHEGYWIHRHAYDLGTLTGPAYWHAVAATSGNAFTHAQVDALIEGDTALWTDLNTPMVNWAIGLQQSGMTTGILSNIGDAISFGILGKFPWLAGFDHCTWSYATGLAKPDPAIYLLTAKALDTPPANILFVDDLEQNIAAALALGMQAIQYKAHPAFEVELQQRGLDFLLHPETSAALV